MKTVHGTTRVRARGQYLETGSDTRLHEEAAKVFCDISSILSPRVRTFPLPISINNLSSLSPRHDVSITSHHYFPPPPPSSRGGE